MPGTIRSNPHFNAEEACKKLQKAMKGPGTDEKTIIEVLTSHDNQQRQQIKSYYQTAYGKELVKELKSELGGNLEDVVLGLMMTPIEWDAYWTHRAMKGAGTNESALIEIFAGRDFPEIEAIKTQYKKDTGNELDKAIQSELSGDFCRLMRGIIAAQGECAGPVDVERAKADAQALYDAGKGAGTDELTFIAILNTRAFPQLRETFNQFVALTNKTIEAYIASEFSGDIKEALLTIVERIWDNTGYFADRLHKSMKGMGTDEKTLTRVIVARCEIDLQDIKMKYQEKHNKALVDAVKSEVSGDYKRILTKIIGE